MMEKWSWPSMSITSTASAAPPPGGGERLGLAVVLVTLLGPDREQEPAPALAGTRWTGLFRRADSGVSPSVSFR